MFPILSKVESRNFAKIYKALHTGPFTACPTSSSFLSSNHKGPFAIAEKCQTCCFSGATVFNVPSAKNFLTQMTAGLIPSLYSGLSSKNKLSGSASTIQYKIVIVIPLKHSLLPRFYFSLWHLASLASI